MSRVEQDRDGYYWINNGVSTDDHLAFGGHEPHLAPFMEALSDPTRSYINVGAHVGAWAIRMAKFNKDVWAFEANPRTIKTLDRNIRLNRLSGKVHSVPAAVWDKAGFQFSLVDVQGKDTGGSTRVSELGEGDRLSCRSVTLDEFFGGSLEAKDFESVGFISMDVEGAEARVLRGAKKLIAKDRPNLLIELHDGHPGTDEDLRKQVYAILDELEYDYSSILVAPPEEHLFCRPLENVEEFPSEKLVVDEDYEDVYTDDNNVPQL